MRTKDFEKAIDALNLGIVIDEMKFILIFVKSLVTLRMKVFFGMRKEKLSLLLLKREKVKIMVN